MASVGGSSRVLVGDCRDTLQQLPDGSVHCVVTSPPYWSLRTYDTDTHNDGLIGLEPTFDEHINNLACSVQTSPSGAPTRRRGLAQLRRCLLRWRAWRSH